MGKNSHKTAVADAAESPPDRGEVVSGAGRARSEPDASFLAAVVENSDDAIVTKDLNGVITSWNRGAERIFGYSAPEAIGRPVTMLIPPDHADEEPEILKCIRRGQRVNHYETVRRRKDGSEINVSLTVSPIKEGGRIIGASKIARDITEQRQAQERLQQSEERFRVTLASIGDAVVSTDRESRVTFMNFVAEKLTGWTLKEAMGMALDAVFNIVNELSHERVESPVARVLRDGVVAGLANHTILISRNGSERPIDDSAAPIRDLKGNVIGVVLVFRDATQQRTAELTARSLAGIVENSDDAIYSSDLSGVVTSWNRGSERIFGYTAREAIGRAVNSLITPAERQAEEEEVFKRLTDGKRVEHYETTRVAKNGREIHVSMMASLFREPWSGRVVGVSKIVRDITRRKQLDEKLKKARADLEDYARNLEATVYDRTARLQQTIVDLEAFSFTVSHDLRSPLRAMEGFAHAVLEDHGQRLDAQGREYLERISNSAERLDKLILEVLNYTRIGREDPPIKPVDLDKLVKEVKQIYPSIGKFDAEIEIAHPLGSVLGSHPILVQSISNLLENALKFVPAGTKPKVRVWTTETGSTIRLFVSDQGIGIPDKLLSRIFEPFQRGHPSAAYEGTGMGLAIVRRAMEKTGGTMGVESQVGKGSTFWIELPAAR